jgi:hypothetical protein
MKNLVIAAAFAAFVLSPASAKMMACKDENFAKMTDRIATSLTVPIICRIKYSKINMLTVSMNTECRQTLAHMFLLCSDDEMSKPPLWFDHEHNQSQWLAALDRARRLSTRGAEIGPHAKALGSLMLIERIREAIDDYAERETGNREFFWGTPRNTG